MSAVPHLTRSSSDRVWKSAIAFSVSRSQKATSKQRSHARHISLQRQPANAVKNVRYPALLFVLQQSKIRLHPFGSNSSWRRLGMNLADGRLLIFFSAILPPDLRCIAVLQSAPRVSVHSKATLRTVSLRRVANNILLLLAMPFLGGIA